MRYDFIETTSCTESFSGFLLQASINEILAFLTHDNSMLLGIWEVHWLALNKFVHLVVVRLTRIEWWEADNHLISENTKSPPIYLEGMTLFFKNLRGKIFRCTTERVSLLVLLKNLCKSKICQTNESIFLHQDIFWLQVSIDNLLIMKMTEGESYAQTIKLGSLLRELP